MNAHEPHEAASAYNRMANERGWKSVCHSALTFQRPELCELLEIWHGLIRHDRLPSRRDLTPRLLRAHLPNVAIYERVMDGGRERYRARVMGQRFTEVLGNYIGKFFDEAMPPEQAARWQAAPHAALVAHGPLRFVSRSETAGKGHITGEYLLAPLLSDDETANTVLSCGFFGPTFQIQGARSALGAN
ncbi:MAG: PAS domain-containing protein [Rhizomicrobium sp.]